MRIAVLSNPRNLFACALGPALLIAGLGCGPGTAVVSGDIQLDGTPIENGTITFEPADKKGPTMGGSIVNGHYEVQGPPGKKNVLVTCTRPTGKKIPAGSPAPPGTMVDELKVFPPQGRSHDPKEVDLTPGQNTFSLQFTTPAGGALPPPGSGPTGPTGPSGPSGPTK